MTNQPVTLKSLIDSQGSDVIHSNIEHGIFISAFHAAMRCGAAVALNAKKIERSAIQDLFAELERQVNCLLKDCELKIVGSTQALQMARTFAEENKIPVKVAHEESATPFEILFYPKTGRLRIAVSTPVQKINAIPSRTVKILIVDDSVTIQKLLHAIFSSDPDMEVVATAGLPSQVEELILRYRPDVITLDIHMPEMDGVTLLKQIMPRYQIPTVMITSLSMDEGSKVLDALESGAVDYIQKPSADALKTPSTQMQIIERIKTAAQANVARRKFRIAQRPTPSQFHGAFDANVVVAIGSSTGGTEAVKEIFTRLPNHIPPILVVQHIPPVFSRAFADRLNNLCPFEVKEAEDGDIVQPDRALIAPGGKHMRLVKSGGLLRVLIDDTPPRNRHKPSVDVLFDSVAETMAHNAVGVILTGMGNDGAQGLLKMKQFGAQTIAQDEASCVVYGMPREAIKLGAAEGIDLFKIPELLVKLLTHSKQATQKKIG